MDETRTRKRQIQEGIVISNKMEKTVTVKVERSIRHPQYRKVILQAKKYYAHTEGPVIEEGKRVKIEETRPLSKLKRWRVVEVLS